LTLSWLAGTKLADERAQLSSVLRPVASPFARLRRSARPGSAVTDCRGGNSVSGGGASEKPAAMEKSGLQQFFGASRHYPGPCVELAFPAPPRPVPVAALEDALRQRVPRWEERLPQVLPPEEAVARLAHAFVASRIPTWFRFRREGGTAVSALGTTVGPAFVATLLVALQHALLGPEEVRAEALKEIDRLAEILRKELAINWSVMDVGRSLGLEAAWISKRTQFYQIGMAARGKHFRQFANECDSITGTIVASDKYHTTEVLRKIDLPTTRATVVRGPADAEAAMQRVGLPCVVKPLSLGRGIGITTGIASLHDLEDAIRRAIAASSAPVLVENHVEGIDHRIMVVGGQVLWAYSKVPASVVGDGVSSVRALIERENEGRNNAKAGGHTLLQPIRIGDELTRFLARRYGVQLTDVLAAGRRVELAGQSNISMGGTLTDVTTQLHPDNRLLAIRVAKYLRIAALGIDFVTPDISRSWKELDCAIIEVNTMPGISGPGDAALPVHALFPRLRSGKIPVLAAIGGDEFRATAAAWLLSAAAEAGLHAKSIEYAGNDRMPKIITTARPRAVEAAVLDPELEALVLSCEPRWIEQRGFPLIRADLVLAEDPGALAFLDGVADEISPLPAAAAAVAERVAGIVAQYADDGPVRPAVTLHADRSAGSFRFQCLRFGALPREWFYRRLDLATDSNTGMIGFADVFAAIDRLSNTALARAGMPILAEAIAFRSPGPGWATPSVEATLPVPGETMDRVEPVLVQAIGAINELLADGAR
jgi:cyanophycin synthetase